MRLGTRGSRLALQQCEEVVRGLAKMGIAARPVVVSTLGDEQPEVPLPQLDARDAFTRELDAALLAGDVDAAVHSLKDIPTTLAPGLVIAAITRREDPADVLVAGRGGWDDLPPRAVVATCSLRRRAQLLRARPDLQIVDIRGNVETRLARLDATPDWHATVLAAAGLHRLGLAARISQRLPSSLMLPAPGQGAIAVVIRADDRWPEAIIRASVHHPETAACVLAERALLGRLEGGCSAPIAALAEPGTGGWLLTARVLSLDGAAAVEGQETWPGLTGTGAREAGERLAERLLRDGAGEVIAATEGGRR